MEDAIETVEEKTTPVIEDVEVVEDVVVEDSPASSEPEIQQPAETRGSVFPMVLGGLIAGGIGFGAAVLYPQFMSGTDTDTLAALQSENAKLTQQVSDLESTVAALKSAPAVPDLSENLAGLDSDLTTVKAAMDTLQSQVAMATDRISVLEKQPLNDAVSPEAIKAYEAELSRLTSEVAKQQEAIGVVAQQASEEIDRARAEAKELEANAAAIAQKGVAQSAIGKIQAAINTGDGFSEAVAELTGTGLV